MDKEFEIFEQAEKSFNNDINSLVSKIIELILKNKQNIKEMNNDRIQFTIVKSLKYFCIKKKEPLVFQKVTNKLKRDLKELNIIDFSININSVLTNEYKTILHEAWCKYIRKIEPIVLETRETWKKISVPYQHSSTSQDREDLSSNIMVLIFEALPNFDYKKKFKLITYAFNWNRSNMIINKEEAMEPDEIDKMTPIYPQNEGEIDMETVVSIQKILENKCNEREKLIVYKRYYLEKTIKEIAIQLEISAPRVFKLINKILFKLKDELLKE